ncbi:conserved hypothetical protein [Methylobacterium sp. 4-46]|uniref:hypothetical protein n=1 Tax=unclassified Methylobacterium TaxID=2615210 RepID=UPI000152D288|nr:MULTISPECIES: hypothetical protein [Methylobacterium]ACA17307.1 conserved hypothetical protein [Methylobacterium sp. 4-46]WFT82992.1 hypothetical protein QA634_14640 [Methylobacterium nodulans]
MPDRPTIGELFKLKAVTDEQVKSAVAASLDGPTPGLRLIAEGVAVDLAAVIPANAYAREVLALTNALEAQRRMAVRTAILLARVEGGA